jgi:hypothetical protein
LSLVTPTGGFPISRDLPAARIGGDIAKGLAAMVTTESNDQVLSMAEFLDAAYDLQLRFGVRPGASPDGRSRWFHGLLALVLREAHADY